MPKAASFLKNILIFVQKIALEKLLHPYLTRSHMIFNKLLFFFLQDLLLLLYHYIWHIYGFFKSLFCVTNLYFIIPYSFFIENIFLWQGTKKHCRKNIVY